MGMFDTLDSVIEENAVAENQNSHLIEKYNYLEVDFSLEEAEELDAKENEIKNNMIRLKGNVLSIGKSLKEIHALLSNKKNGTFKKWLLNNRVGEEQAYQFIHQYEISFDFPQKSEYAASLSYRMIRELNRKNTPEEIKRLAIENEVKTPKEFKEIIKNSPYFSQPKQIVSESKNYKISLTDGELRRLISLLDDEDILKGKLRGYLE